MNTPTPTFRYLTTANLPIQVYDLAISARVTWQAHSLSNTGSNGSNRVMPRRQLLATGQETDACSGNITKHYHAALLAEYLEAANVPLCPACRNRDARRIEALKDQPEYKDVTMEQVITQCGLCDAHGFLVTAKGKQSISDHNAQEEHNGIPDQAQNRQRRSKHSLVNFSFVLALPDSHAETPHIYTRAGDSKEEGQMIMKMTARSGTYALQVRYQCVGVGVDTDKWQLILTDQQQRRDRHGAILSALRDLLMSPDGAMTATMLPHLTGLQGAVVLQGQVGRAPLYSALAADYLAQLQAIADENCSVYIFNTIEEFRVLMRELIDHTLPAFPSSYTPQPTYEEKEQVQRREKKHHA